jgi:integrase
MTVVRGGKITPYTWTDADGKRHKSWRWSVNVEGRQQRRQGYSSKSEAETALDQFKAELAAPKSKPSITLGQAFEKYFETKARKKSLAEDRRQAEHLTVAFGEDTPLVDVTSGRIADYKATRLATKSRQFKAPLSAAAVNRPLALLRHLLRLAHSEWDLLAAVPTVRLEDEPEGRLRWLTPEEANRLLAAARESRNPDLADLIELSLFTGLRQSEALELTWDRVDRSRGVLLLDVTKSGRRRQVPLNEGADAVLARRGPKDEGLVFSSSNWDRYRTAWDGAVKRAKLTDLRWHDLRHTFASWAVQRRVSLYELKELLGHSTLTMVKRYAHLAPEHLRAAAAALDGVLASSKPDSKEKASEPVEVR